MGQAKRIKDVSGWQTPATSYPRRRQGNAEIGNHWYRPGTYDAYLTGPPGEEGYHYYRLDRRRTRITCLKISREIWMVDDCPHWWAIQDHAAIYHGHVLCAGLGLGLIVHALHANPAVTGITVVEREQDVIALVSPLLPAGNPATIVHADWYEYEPNSRPDGVFYDLFVGNGRALLDEAMHERIQLAIRFGDIPTRIHGFDNQALDQLAAPILIGRTTHHPSPGGTQSWP